LKRSSVIAQHLGQKASRVRLLIVDVDGVLTGGEIIMGSGKMELKYFHTLDGFGVVMAQRAGLRVAIITARASEAVEMRAGDLGIKDFFQGRLNKEEAYLHLLQKHHLRDEQVAYVGDDLLDLPVFTRAGLKVAVANAHAHLKAQADYVTIASGGRGAVREVVELLLGWGAGEGSQIGEKEEMSPSG
jgi:3-deoxy-D-manno-octulosonate 8-phosphate phosphatase (KDO 8-P phosphatase)